MLESSEGKPVARPVPLRLRKARVGVVRETIGRVESPLYVAGLDAGVDAKKLVGKTLESG